MNTRLPIMPSPPLINSAVTAPAVLPHFIVSSPPPPGGTIVTNPGLATDDGHPKTHQPEVTRLICLGDVHGRWNRVQSILNHEFPHGNGVALSVGDFETFHVLSGQHSVHFVHGNHEDFDSLRELHSRRLQASQQYHPLFAGDTVRIGGLTIAGIPGIYDEISYDVAGDTPLIFYTRAMIENMLRLERSVDILLMHEPPSGAGFKWKGVDVGNPFLASVVTYLKPRLVLFGHFHGHFFGKMGQTFVVGLDYPHRGYVILEHDSSTDVLKATRIAARLHPDGRGYKYDWQSGQTDDTIPLFKERISVGRRRDFEEILKRDHYDRIHAEIKAQLVELFRTNPRIKPHEVANVADMRALLALNRAIPHAAAYAVECENKGNIPPDELRKLTDRIYDEMCRGLDSQESQETLYAYQACLIALGLVSDKHH